MALICLKKTMRNIGDEKIREIFGGWKSRNGYSEQEAATWLRMNERTLARRKHDPGSMTVEELRRLVAVTKADPETVWTMVTGRRRT